MRFDILNRFTLKVQFTADIDCEESAESSLKVGLAVKWGYANGADLYGADLRGADLRGADLYGADLYGADLYGADLYGADGQIVKLKKTPMQILGGAYSVMVFDGHIQIGCQLHTVDEWAAYSTDQVEGMAAVAGADGYRLYYACEPGIDVENYGAYECGSAVFDVTSPHTLTALAPAGVYRVIVTAVDANGEGAPSAEVYAAPRYSFDVTDGTVRDAVNGLEWMLCSRGQTWDAVTGTCIGELLRGSWQAIMLARPDGWSVPTVDQLHTLRFCDSGSSTAHFPPVDAGCSPPGGRGVIALPAESIGSASVYLTSTYTGGGERALTFAFGPAGGGVSPASIRVDDAEIAVYARYVRVSP